MGLGVAESIGPPFGHRRIGFDFLRVIAAIFSPLVTIQQECVELIDEAVEYIVGIVTFDVRDKIWAADFNVPRRDIVVLARTGLIFVQPNVEADDPLVVPEQNREFFSNDTLHRRREFHMDAL